MKNYFSNLDKKLLCIIRTVGREAGQRKIPAYIVGGIVRDIILKKSNLDLDIVIEGDAIALAKVLAKKLKARLKIYREFGTATLVIPCGGHLDLATARRESYVRSGALPMVQPGNLDEDLFRRDFTINAMAIAIGPKGFSGLIDKFGGLKDLSGKKIRILHKKSFLNDPTRILRAVRFEQRFHFNIERGTLTLMKAALKKNIFKKIKPPRYFNDLKKILTEEDPLRCLKRLHQLGALKGINAHLDVDLSHLSCLHKNILQAKRMKLYKDKDYQLIYLMGLLAKSKRAVVNRILKRFPFTKSERVSIRQAQDSGVIINALSVGRLSHSQVYQVLKPLTAETVLYLRVLTDRMSVYRRIDRFLKNDIDTQLLINGRDLKRMGLVSGAKIGKILKDVLYLKIDKRVRTKKDELNAVLLSSERY